MGNVSLQVYDMAGRRARTLVDEAQVPQVGGFSKTWNGRNDRGQPVASGVYSCTFTTSGFSQARKVVVLR